MLITTDDLHLLITEEQKQAIQPELVAIIAGVKSIAFSYMSFTEDDLEGSALIDFRNIVIWESEARYLFRNTETALRPPHGNKFFSADAYEIWKMYL
jgi:hypothetical protein